MKTILLTSLAQQEHNQNLNHPDSPERFLKLLNLLKTVPYPIVFTNRYAKKKDLLRVHDGEYIEKIFSRQGERCLLDQETFLTQGSVDALLSASGTGLELVDLLYENKYKAGFALIRPPGHHASKNKASGYCIFNHIAIAAEYAITKGFKKILIFDFDAHHGNGTQSIFYARNDILYVDIHEDNLFPAFSGSTSERGTGDGLGFTINLPMKKYSGDSEYEKILREILIPETEKFKPDLILVSAGFDLMKNDPEAHLSVSKTGIKKITHMLLKLAQKHANGKIGFFLEGGYNDKNLLHGVSEILKVLQSKTE